MVPSFGKPEAEDWTMGVYGDWARVASLAMVLAFLGGCAITRIPPTYTQEELKAICGRHGAWWRPDDLRGGHCDHDSHL